MRTVLLILSALLSLSVLAPLSGAVSTGNAAMAVSGSDAQHDPACPDDCCEDCPDFTQCQMGCALAVLPDTLADAPPMRFTPNQAEPIAPYRSAKLPPATPPPRAAARL
jgi:hypothetical protein